MKMKILIKAEGLIEIVFWGAPGAPQSIGLARGLRKWSLIFIGFFAIDERMFRNYSKYFYNDGVRRPTYKEHAGAWRAPFVGVVSCLFLLLLSD